MELIFQFLVDVLYHNFIIFLLPGIFLFVWNDKDSFGKWAKNFFELDHLLSQIFCVHKATLVFICDYPLHEAKDDTTDEEGSINPLLYVAQSKSVVQISKWSKFENDEIDNRLVQVGAAEESNLEKWALGEKGKAII